eukprot:6337183-Prorocentrum_lima.AAC.1
MGSKGLTLDDPVGPGRYLGCKDDLALLEDGPKSTRRTPEAPLLGAPKEEVRSCGQDNDEDIDGESKGIPILRIT